MKKRMILMVLGMAAFIAVVGSVKFFQVRAAIAQYASFQPPPEAVGLAATPDPCIIPAAISGAGASLATRQISSGVRGGCAAGATRGAMARSRDRGTEAACRVK